MPPESIYRFVRCIDRPEAGVIFLGCTNLGTFTMIEELEAEVGKTVITSNLATFWRCLRIMGLPDRIDGFGQLPVAH